MYVVGLHPPIPLFYSRCIHMQYINTAHTSTYGHHGQAVATRTACEKDCAFYPCDLLCHVSPLRSHSSHLRRRGAATAHSRVFTSFPNGVVLLELVRPEAMRMELYVLCASTSFFYDRLLLLPEFWKDSAAELHPFERFLGDLHVSVDGIHSSLDLFQLFCIGWGKKRQSSLLVTSSSLLERYIGPPS